MARLFVVLAPLGALTAVAAEILNTVVHYTLKSDLIQQCTQVEIGTRVKDYYGNVTELTEAQAKDCKLKRTNSGGTPFRELIPVRLYSDRVRRFLGQRYLAMLCLPLRCSICCCQLRLGLTDFSKTSSTDWAFTQHSVFGVPSLFPTIDNCWTRLPFVQGNRVTPISLNPMRYNLSRLTKTIPIISNRLILAVIMLASDRKATYLLTLVLRQLVLLGHPRMEMGMPRS